MSDFSVNENKDFNTAEDVESTVFSAPAGHENESRKKKSPLTVILAALLAVAVLAGTTAAVIKLIPVKEEETEEAPVAVTDMYLTQYAADDISKVTVVSESGKTEFYSKEVDEGDELTVNYWYIRGIKKSYTDYYSVEDTVESFLTVKYSRTIEEKNLKECGLKNPAYKITVTPKQGEEYTLLLGEKSIDNMGYYAKLKDSDTVYLVEDGVFTAAEFDVLDFADTTAIAGFTNDDGELDDRYSQGQLNQFDKVVLSGKAHPQPVEIVLNEETELSDYLGYMVTAPQKRIAQNTEALLLMYQGGVEVAGAYSFDVTEESLEKFGLSDPDLITTMYVLDQSITYKFALQEDGYYAAIGEESEFIYKVEPSVLDGIAGLTAEDYYSGWVFYTSIDEITDFKVYNSSESYEFSVSKNETEEEDSEEDYTVTYEGENVVARSFQYLYQYCVSLRCADFTEDSLTAEPEVVIELALKEGGKSVIEFTPYSATKYQCSVDGIVMGKVSVNAVDKVIANAQKVANGETISEIA